MTEVRFRVIDLETTGMDPPEEIVETGCTDLIFNTETKESVIGNPTAWLWRPSKPIPPEAMAVHHITDIMVGDRPQLSGDDLDAFLQTDKPQFIVAHQAAFEKKWLDPHVPEASCWWIDTFKCALRIWDDAPGHSNQVLRYWLGLDLPDDLAMPPHRAGPDSYVTAHILAKMLPLASVKDLVGWTLAPRYYGTCPLQKWRGKPWGVIDAGYLRWMTTAPDMEPDLKDAAQAELNRRSGR